MSKFFSKPRPFPPAQPPASGSKPAQPKIPQRTRHRAKSEDESEKLPQVDEPGTYTDYKIFTPSLELTKDRKYNGYKFDIHKPVNVLTWDRPVKLNRKDPIKRTEDFTVVADGPLVPMLGVDGKPVVGSDGNMVMLGPDGRPAAQHARPKFAPSEKSVPGKKKPFQRKTKQVFPVSEATRQLRKEERYPWVLEDASGKEVWVGQLDDISKSDTHAFFMPNLEGRDFVFVPSHRWYKMQKRPTYRTLGLEEAEEELAKLSKSKNPQFWLMHNKGKQLSDATTATLKRESGEGMSSTSASTSLGPGGRKLKTVDTGQRSRFEQDDEFGEGGEQKRRNKELGEEGGVDEMEFEDDFADDDEGGQMDAIDDEEAKELEERLKAEYRAANKTREGYIDESEDEEDDSQLTGAGKDMRKIVKKLDKGAADDSDKEENPYASSVESDDEEPTPEPTSVQNQTQAQPAANGSQNGTNPSSRPTPKPSAPSTPHRPHGPGSAPPSRANSPGLGNSIVAKRATSPKAPKPLPLLTNSSGSRATSPLAGGGSRAASPSNLSPMGSRATSPSAPTSNIINANGKRKAEDHDGVASAPSPTSPIAKPKKRKMDDMGSLTDEMFVDWLQKTPNATTKDCINRFKKYVRDEAKKQEFTAMIQRLARIRGGVLVLRSGGGASNPPTPAPMSPTPK